ncbi:MAG: hypothetical protein AB1689_28825 [Thermodesulfobacteriota bacterium]
MRLSRIVVACVALLALGIEASAADRPAAINPTDVMTKRVFARGQGSLFSPVTQCPSPEDCPYNVYVTFDHGAKTLRGDMVVPIEFGETDPFTLCTKFKGTGTLGDHLAVQLVGDLCVQGGIRYSLSASMQAYDNTAECGCQDVSAAAGRLEMFGAVKTLGPKGPYTLQSIATFVGGTGRPAVCCP